MTTDNEPPKEIWERKKLGIDLRQKFELYFVSLAFTLVGLSVQTATRSGPSWRLPIEITGWVLLLVAGLVGLWRISKLWQREVGVAEYHESLWSTPNRALKTELEKLEKKIRIFGTAQYGTFLLGFVLVVVSRAVALLCS